VERAAHGQCLKRMPRRRSRRFEETIQSIAGLRAEHHANATQHRRVVDRITSLMGSATLHRGADSLRCRLGEFERPRRGPWLSRARPASLCMAGGRSVAGVPLLVILILTTQRGDDRLTQRRELLNLELTILSEQKITKVVALLEQLRQDSPHLRDRVDELAEAMSQPADPQSVIDAIKETRSASAHVSHKAEGV
jgi:uncharacterized membrane protein